MTLYLKLFIISSTCKKSLRHLKKNVTKKSKPDLYILEAV